MKITKSESEKLFNDLYVKMSNKIEESTETIFSDVSIAEQAQTHYNEFMESQYSKLFFQESSTYEKNKVIKSFIENEVLSDIYTSTYDHLIFESTDNELSFSQQIILENTQEQFGVRYKGDNTNNNVDIIEEFSLAGIGATLGVGAMFGVIPATAFAGITFLGMNLLFPSRYARASDMFFEKSLGLLGIAVFGTKSLLSMGNTSLAASNNNILNFDNIDVNPDVRKLFNTLARSNNKKAPIDGINTIVANCLENNNALEAGDIDPSQAGYFRGQYSPKNNSVFTVFVESLFKKSASKSDEEFGTLIKYRRCLSEKLVDMYKFLMIANISQSKEYKKIIRVMKKGFHTNPEQLLTFIHTDTESDQISKENIITLIKFRLFLDEMASDLKKGAFDVDREASIYLTQRLSQVDNEIEDYLSKNQKRIETAFESHDDFRRKDFKYNKIPDRNLKRNLFGTSDKVN